jgi:hypothetical protein
MALEKLLITPLPPSGLAEIEVQFNPTTLSIGKTVNWGPKTPSANTARDSNRELDAAPIQFNGGGGRSLSVELFFDVTEQGPGADVRTETNQVVALTRIERDQPQPPVCRLSWGNAPEGSDFPLQVVVNSLTQSFKLFRETGEPLRATLTVGFVEYINAEDNKRETDPELSTYVVKRGDSLSGISAKLYRDPAQWRVIALANRIEDPLRLKVGERLTIPKI